jgi:hypothetical protein
VAIIHNLEELHEGSDQEHDPDNFELASEVTDDCLVELNMLKSSQQTSSWYLDSGATHHVSGDPSGFKSIHPASGACISSEGGHSLEVIGIGTVDIPVSSGAIKSVSSDVYTPGITKKTY